MQGQLLDPYIKLTFFGYTHYKYTHAWQKSEFQMIVFDQSVLTQLRPVYNVQFR